MRHECYHYYDDGYFTWGEKEDKKWKKKEKSLAEMLSLKIQFLS